MRASLLWCLLLSAFALACEGAELRVMSFNLWHGGDEGKQPLTQSAAVIRAAKADVAGLQETGGIAPRGAPQPDNARKIAGLLNWNFFDQGNRRAIITALPIVTNSPAKLGVQLKGPGGQSFWVFNVHFAHAPYQPYQLLSIPYEGGAFLKTEQEAIAAAKAARGEQVQALLRDMEASIRPGEFAFITGDFNEPSHQDWTAQAAAAGLCPVAVQWPSTKAVTTVGFTDSFRKARPDELKHRGLTWTPLTKENDQKDRHDRIDFVFYRGPLDVIESQVVGERPERAEIVVLPYPSDHRGVVSAFRLRD